MDINKEVWKEIKGYEGRYMISNQGNVRSLLSNKILKPGQDGAGYLQVALSDKNRNRKTRRVHRLVGIAFVSNPNNLNEINHVNGIKDDPRAENLEWTTHKGNMEHAFANKMIRSARGERQHMSKLNRFQVRVIRKITGMNYEEIANVFNVTPENIGIIRNRKSWKHIF